MRVPEVTNQHVHKHTELLSYVQMGTCMRVHVGVSLWLLMFLADKSNDYMTHKHTCMHTQASTHIYITHAKVYLRSPEPLK